MKKKLRIAAFGFRSIPMREGCAGADKFALELFPRLVKLGNEVVAYNRLYPGQNPFSDEFNGVKLKYFTTIHKKGFDTLVHSFKSTWDIIFHNTADIVHIQNGGNSIWALFLRLAGKKVFISQDGIDWKRDKWPWYGKVFLRISTFFTAYLPTQVIFDNIFTLEVFEKRFRKKFTFIPFGSEVHEFTENYDLFNKLGIKPREFFLFVGRFIPDKGLHYLIPSFEEIETDKKLILVGGSPNPSDYEKKLLMTRDQRIVFPGYIYGDDVLTLMKNAYCYIQPSDVEGLSPVILNVMGLGTPIVCSNIRENIYAVGENAVIFEKGNVNSLKVALQESLDNYEELKKMAERARRRALTEFTWEKVAFDHEKIFREEPDKNY